MLADLPRELVQIILELIPENRDTRALLCVDKRTNTLVKKFAHEYCFGPSSMGQLSVLTILTTPRLTRVHRANISLNCCDDIAGITLDRCIVSLPTVDHILSRLRSLPLRGNMYVARRLHSHSPVTPGCYFLMLRENQGTIYNSYDVYGRAVSYQEPGVEFHTNIPYSEAFDIISRRDRIIDTRSYIRMYDTQVPVYKPYPSTGYGVVHTTFEPMEVNLTELNNLGIPSQTFYQFKTDGEPHYLIQHAYVDYIVSYLNGQIPSSKRKRLRSIFLRGRLTDNLQRAQQCVKYTETWGRLIYDGYYTLHDGVLAHV